MYPFQSWLPQHGERGQTKIGMIYIWWPANQFAESANRMLRFVKKVSPAVLLVAEVDELQDLYQSLARNITI